MAIQNYGLHCVRQRRVSFYLARAQSTFFIVFRACALRSGGQDPCSLFTTASCRAILVPFVWSLPHCMRSTYYVAADQTDVAFPYLSFFLPLRLRSVPRTRVGYRPGYILSWLPLPIGGGGGSFPPCQHVNGMEERERRIRKLSCVLSVGAGTLQPLSGSWAPRPRMAPPSLPGIETNIFCYLFMLLFLL